MTNSTQNLERTYPHGVPCWIDTEQPDVDAAIAFYGPLFGWTFEERPTPSDERYVIAELDGRPAAALASGRGEVAWNTYVRVDNTDATLARALGSGAREVWPTQDAGPAGRWAAFADPDGAELRLWQPGRRTGVQAANTPGAWNFTDLQSADPVTALAWYADLFGWEGTDSGFATMLRVPGYGRHLQATVDPGIFERHATAPAGFSDAIGWIAALSGGGAARWMTTFTVADRDRSAETVESLGGVVLETEETAWTRMATIRDPQGAALVLSQFTPPESW